MSRVRQAALVAALCVAAAPLNGLAAQSRQNQSPSTADVAAIATPATVTILALGANDDGRFRRRTAGSSRGVRAPRRPGR